jgi:hypothetical protein
MVWLVTVPLIIAATGRIRLECIIMKPWIVGAILATAATLGAPAWADPTIRCSTLTDVYSNQRYPPAIKTWLGNEIGAQWREITKHEMANIDEINIYIACLNAPGSSVEDMFQAVLRQQPHRSMD